MTREDIVELVAERRLIAILRGHFSGKEVDVAQALIDGGVRALEVSAVSPDYAGAIRRLEHELDGRVALGVGTAVTPEIVSAAFEAGARFIVAPNIDPQVMERARELGMAIFPGAYTPSEIFQSIRCRADGVKLFPALTLGPEFVRALRSVIPGVRLIPTGGITLDNLAGYLAAGAWAVGVGSELVGRESDWDRPAELRKRAEQFATLALTRH